MLKEVLIMPRSFPPALIITLCLVAGCHSNGPIAPGGNNTPPQWTGAAGISSVVPGEHSVTLHWKEAIDMQDPPVSYLLYKDTDGTPFDQLPISLKDTSEYTFRPLAYSIAYTFGVRTRDSARPPHVDDNSNVLSAVPLPIGWVDTWGGAGKCPRTIRRSINPVILT